MRRHLAAQASSDQTVGDYCAYHHFSVATYYYWRRKLAQTSAAPDSGFCQIVTTAATASRKLRFSTGMSLELEGLSLSELAVLIVEIERAHA